MNRRRLILSIVMFIAIVGSMFTIDLFTDRTPVLGLDLRGGLSVIYAPEESAVGKVDAGQLELVRDLMRSQLEDFGIAEPDVRVEGTNIVADLPGVNDQESAFDALQVSGIVELRPVLQCFPDPAFQDATVTADTVAGSTPAGSTPAGSTPAGSTPAGSNPAGTAPDSTSPTSVTTADSITIDTVPDTSVGEVDELGLGYFGSGRTFSAPVETTPDATTPDATTPDATTPDATTPVDSTPDTTPGDGTIEVTTDPSVPLDINDLTVNPTPDPAVGDDSQTVLAYPKARLQCLVGPPGGSGEVFAQDSAAAGIDTQGGGGWEVTVNLTDVGLVQWNALASQCYNAAPTCPSNQLAIVLDSDIITAPQVRIPTFDRTGVSISGMEDQEEAENLVKVLDRGAFPFKVEPQRTETVSPSAGQDSLNAAIIAGLVGVAIMLFTMVLYYRRLAIIMILGLTIWGITVFTLATLVSRATNFALTLAGATGIIIAVGVTVDTYVVFFERLRDEMRAGRSFANAAPRGYRATGRTVLSADVVSLIASLVLFALSVGSVRGFALYLGITTVCDLLVFYFFTRPAVLLLGMSAWGKARSRSNSKIAGVSS